MLTKIQGGRVIDPGRLDKVADIIVEDKVILELKAVKDLHPAHEAQLTNYLKASGIEVGLLINFGERVEVKRKVFTPP